MCIRDRRHSASALTSTKILTRDRLCSIPELPSSQWINRPLCIPRLLPSVRDTLADNGGRDVDVHLNAPHDGLLTGPHCRSSRTCPHVTPWASMQRATSGNVGQSG